MDHRGNSRELSLVAANLAQPEVQPLDVCENSSVLQVQKENSLQAPAFKPHAQSSSADCGDRRQRT